jgi:1,4-alpha-glucan branching enzyme
MKKIYCLFFLLLPLVLQAQVSTEPEFVQHDQPVTIYYDASQGTSGLEGAAKVYMHAGVVTAGPTSTEWKYVKGNWGKDDGVGQMEKVAGQDNLWKITLPSPREYFAVPANETIYRIGMVFRNADGSREGKSAQNGDIFVQVYEGFALSISQPQESTLFANSGEQITVEAQASAPATITVRNNGQLVQTQTNTTSITYSFTFSGANDRERIVISATDGTSTSADSVDVLKRVTSPAAQLPSGNLQQGLNRISNTEITLLLMAPGKNSVYVVGDFTNWEIDPAYLMNKAGDVFWLTIPNLNPTTEYLYYYLVDQSIKVADPYSEKVLDSGNDQYINATRYPNLRSFPAAAATDRLTAFRIQEEEYEWQTTGYSRPKKEDLIIYELLVRDFSAEESFQGIIDRLDYLDSLHVTAIQLMPVMEFNGNDSWGYNPTFMTALDKWYGPKNKLKELVDKAHQRGMAVILDITLNHQDYPAPFLKMWWAGSTASADNPFFNQQPTHPYNVFTDMNHESRYTKQFLDIVNQYWLEEYKIDGYRFDLSKGFTQKESGDNVGAWSAYDASRVALLKRMADQIWNVDENAYVILEHFADNSEETELANYGMMLWGGLHHNYGQAIMGYDITSGGSDFRWVSYKARGWNEPNLVGYMESHDEERQIYKALQHGNSSGGYSVKELETALDRVKLAAAFFIPVPGPKMIWQFGELGYDISIDQNGRTGKKPLRWEYLNDPKRQQLYRTFSALNYLKTEYPVFETEDFQMPGTGAVRTLKLNSPDMNVLIVGNFGLSQESTTVSFQHGGWWYSYFHKDSVQANNNLAVLQLNPGEFRFFFDQRIFYEGAGGNPLGLQDTQFAQQISVYPNPASRLLHIHLPQQSSPQAIRYQLITASGRQIQQGLWQPGGTDSQQLSIEHLPAGLYVLKIEQGKEIAIKRFIKQ